MADQVQELIALLAKSQANTERMAAAFESNQRPNELTMAGLSEARQKQMTTPPPPQKFRVLRGRSSVTKATFSMIVIQSRAFPKGRVVRLEEYRHPKGIETHQAMKGLVPDGLPIRNGGSNTSEVGPDGESRGVVSSRNGMNLVYLQWRWEEFYQTDLRRLVSKAVLPEECLDAKDLDKVAWKDSETFTLDENPENADGEA